MTRTCTDNRGRRTLPVQSAIGHVPRVVSSLSCLLCIRPPRSDRIFRTERPPTATCRPHARRARQLRGALATAGGAIAGPQVRRARPDSRAGGRRARAPGARGALGRSALLVLPPRPPRTRRQRPGPREAPRGSPRASGPQPSGSAALRPSTWRSASRNRVPRWRRGTRRRDSSRREPARPAGLRCASESRPLPPRARGPLTGPARALSSPPLSPRCHQRPLQNAARSPL